MQWCPEFYWHDGHRYLHFGSYYFGVALLFKPCSAAQKLEVQNNACEKDPPMYGKVIIF